jgi:hypothetical protein
MKMKEILCIGVILTCLDLQGMLVLAGGRRDGSLSRGDDGSPSRSVATQAKPEVPRIGAAETLVKQDFVKDGDKVIVTFVDYNKDSTTLREYLRQYPIIFKPIPGYYQHNMEEGFSCQMQELRVTIDDVETLRNEQREFSIGTKLGAERILHQYEPTGADSPGGRAFSRVFMVVDGDRVEVANEYVHDYPFVWVPNNDSPLIAMTREQLLEEHKRRQFSLVSISSYITAVATLRQFLLVPTSYITAVATFGMVYGTATPLRQFSLVPTSYITAVAIFGMVYGTATTFGMVEAEKTGGIPCSGGFSGNAPLAILSIPSVDDLWIWPYRPLIKALKKMLEMLRKYEKS